MYLKDKTQQLHIRIDTLTYNALLSYQHFLDKNLNIQKSISDIVRDLIFKGVKDFYNENETKH